MRERCQMNAWMGVQGVTVAKDPVGMGWVGGE
jgi:hypothetical protein